MYLCLKSWYLACCASAGGRANEEVVLSVTASPAGGLLELTPSFLFLSYPVQEVEGSTLLHGSAKICCLTIDTQSMGPISHGLESPRL